MKFNPNKIPQVLTGAALALALLFQQKPAIAAENHQSIKPSRVEQKSTFKKLAETKKPVVKKIERQIKQVRTEVNQITDCKTLKVELH
jgi:flagellar biosynthesis protein FliP